MNDRTEAALREALHERGEQISPTPALPGILHRAARTRAPRRRWLPMGVAALASAGLVTAGVLVFGPSQGPDRPPVASEPTSEPVDEPGQEPVTVEPGTVVPMAIPYVSDFQGGTLVSGEFEVQSNGDVGVDAVRTLMDAGERERFWNWWSMVNWDPSDPRVEVNSVLVGEDVITVDFSGQVVTDCPDTASCIAPDAEMAMQQLVYTLHSALRTDLPVLVTVDGEAADQAFGKPLDNPVTPDPSVAPAIRIESPEQQATVGSPVVVTGESTSFEGTLQWAAMRDGEVVDEGFTMGGSMGEFAPFELRVKLEPGSYTIAVWEDNAAGESEGLAPRLNPAYLAVTVG
jgi:hypothetical protein